MSLRIGNTRIFVRVRTSDESLVDGHSSQDGGDHDNNSPVDDHWPHSINQGSEKDQEAKLDGEQSQPRYEQVCMHQLYIVYDLFHYFWGWRR